LSKKHHIRSTADREEKGGKLSPGKAGRTAVNFDLEHPLFCFRYLVKGWSISDCDQQQKSALADALLQLSQLTWMQIKLAPKHGSGSELIPRAQIKSSAPSRFTENVERFMALRFFGKAALVGHRDGHVLHLIWLDRNQTLAHGHRLFARIAGCPIGFVLHICPSRSVPFAEALS
jgi:hypothetical protein